MSEKKRSIWIATPGEGARLWEDNYNAGIFSIGFDFLGDLKQYKTRDDIERVLLEHDPNKYPSNHPKNDSLCIWEFVNDINIGDIIFIKKGRKAIIGVGIVASTYIYDGTRKEYTNTIKVNYIKSGEWDHVKITGFLAVTKTLTDVTKYSSYCNNLLSYFGLMDNDTSENEVVTLSDKNIKRKKQIILQGAPGVGKTYTAQEIAVDLIDKSFRNKDRRSKMNFYKELVKDERIFFTTFHQSMDYEEFIEGLKPKSDEESNTISYIVKKGVFRKACDRANDLLRKNKIEKYAIDKEKHLDIDEAIKLLAEKLKTEENHELSFTTLSRHCNFTLLLDENDLLFVKTGSSKLRSVSFDEMKSFYLYSKKYYTMHSSYYMAILDKMMNDVNFLGKLLISKDEFDKLPKIQSIESDSPVILIIDEINRGNITKIFGELITLLESDKREDGENAISVMLPYSQEQFSVPSNLYIIGTMNSADRSIGNIDYALRRRFAFITLQSKREKVAEFYGDDKSKNDLKEHALKYFDEMSLLFTRDNMLIPDIDPQDIMIGHSYYMASDIDELNMKIELEVQPLIKEYVKDGILKSIFFEDESTDE